MGNPLAVLIVEDSDSDAQLIVRLLKKAGYEITFQVVETAAQMRAALAQSQWDIVISDYSLPQFDGPAALRLLQATGLDLPFIAVSGMMGEAAAVAMMQAGAHDYLMKDNLVRLAPAVKRELTQAEVRREHRQAESQREAALAALRENEEFLSNLLEHAPVSIYVTDANGRMRLVNRRWESDTAKQRSDVLERPLDQIFSPKTARQFAAWNQKVIEAGVSLAFEEVAEAPVEPHHFFTVKFPLRNARGEIEAVGGISVDITERKRAEDALRESEDKFKYVFDYSVVGKSITLPSGEIQVNQALCVMLGYSPEEFQNKRWQDITHPDDLEMTQQEIDALLSGEKRQVRFTKRYLQKNGSVVWTDVSSSLRRDPQGQPLYLMTTVVDITAYKQVEEERQAHLRFFQSMDQVNRAIQSTHDLEKMMSAVLETTLSIFDCDRAWLLYPCDPEAPSFRVPMEVTKPEYPGAKILNVDVPMSPGEARNMQEALASEAPVTYIAGTERPISTAKQFSVQSQVIVPVYPKLGKPWVFGMHQCSYPRIWTQEETRLLQEIGRRLEDALTSLLAYRDLRESEARYRAIVEDLPVLICRFLPDGALTFVNDTYCRYFGKSRAELIGHSFTPLIPAEDQAYVLQQFGSLSPVQPAASYEHRVFGPDGAIRWQHWIDRAVFDGAQLIEFQSIGEDITDRKQAEAEIQKLNAELEDRVVERTAELARQRERERAILDAMGEGVVFTDRAGMIEYINPALERLTGFTAQELVGQNPRLWQSGQTPPAIYRQLWDTISRGETWQGEMVNRRQDGRLYEASLTAAPLTNPDQQIVGFVGVQRDITRQKQLDRLKDKFVSNVSHELRTPLTNILLNLNLLDHGKPEKRDRYLATLHREAERLRQMIEDLLDISRLDRERGPVELASIDLHQFLGPLVADQATLAVERGLTLEFLPTAESPLALAEVSMLTQVVSNLITNALNYTPAGGHVTVQTHHQRAVAQDWLTLTVRDTGPGIAAHELPHVFERFYRGEVGRKAKAPGTGLGLAISKEIIEKLGGRITVESQPVTEGRGTAFTVWLRPPP
jgi:PAS domain S-box-containing protein